VTETTALALEPGHTLVSYRTYWLAWGFLLLLTIAMVFVQGPLVLIAGMTLKASVIALLFMHLGFEKLDLTLVIAISIVGLSLLLFGLMIPDGRAM